MKFAAALLLGVGAALLFAAPAEGQQDKVTICHATGSAGNPYVTLKIPRNAAFGKAGHFNENGTTRAGHEDDYLGPCRTTTTTTSTTSTSTTSTTSSTTSTTSSTTTTTTEPERETTTTRPRRETTTTTEPERETTTTTVVIDTCEVLGTCPDEETTTTTVPAEETTTTSTVPPTTTSTPPSFDPFEANTGSGETIGIIIAGVLAMMFGGGALRIARRQ